jgi:hypothetical protein
VELAQQTHLQLTLNLTLNVGQQEQSAAESSKTAIPADSISLNPDLSQNFPLLRSLEPEREGSVHRFSVTQLINYQRCPRQYYFDRVLHVPTADQMAVWNEAEAPEPPANLTATLKGAVIHRFCELYTTKDDAEELLRQSFNAVVKMRQAELADRLIEIDSDAAIADLLPLAQNYLSSSVFERIERARAMPGGISQGKVLAMPRGEPGLWSELSFRLRRPLGILTGAIDKLLITPSADGKGVDVEIIDFKTNRLRPQRAGGSASTPTPGPRASRPHRVEGDTGLSVAGVSRAGRPRSQYKVEQIAFDFNAPAARPEEIVANEFSVEDRVRIAASDYELQMQAYALAVVELMPSLVPAVSSITSTLHFLEPNVEFHLADNLLDLATCVRAIDSAMMEIVSSSKPAHFPVRPATHCRMCNFLGICPAGRDWLSSRRQTTGAAVNLLKTVEAGR